MEVEKVSKFLAQSIKRDVISKGGNDYKSIERIIKEKLIKEKNEGRM